MTQQPMTEAELKEFLTALRDNCGNKEKVQWYDGLIEDIGIAFTEHIPDAEKMLESKELSDVELLKAASNISLEGLNEVSGKEDKSLYETQICLQTLINRVRQAVNKKELILSVPFQKAFDNALYIIKKYSTPSDTFRIVQSESKEPISEDELEKQFYSILSYGNSSAWITNDKNAKELVKIAQQHTNSRLSELEKWCDEVIKEQHYEIAIASFDEVKEKIQSLKQ